MSSLPVSESEGEGSGTSVQVPSRGGQVTPGEKAFSLRTKHVFLTYPRCPISPEEAGQKIAEGLKNKKCNYIYISREFHADGEPHLHAFVQLEANFRTTSPKYFDLDEFHPNIQAARQPTNTLKYCMKHPESSWEFGKFLKPKVNRSPTQSASRDKTMKQIMANATNRDEYLSMIRKSFPFEWAVRLQQFQYSANALFPDPPQSYSAPYASRDMSDHPVIGEWLQQELYTVRSPGVRRRSLYICGPTRTGKTSWARSLGTHHYWQHSVNFLEEWNCQAQFNIIDDIPFKFVPCWKGLVGSQYDLTVNPKYGKKKRIPNGIPCIILVNEDEDWLQSMSTQQVDWFHGNAVVYHLLPGETFIPTE
uniref:Replication-associated protein n=1 Tax=Chloris striate mosaic virus TaxID=10820 RepID=J7FGI6_CSMV|nr:Rep [Chloris striate mosaic virus]